LFSQNALGGYGEQCPGVLNNIEKLQITESIFGHILQSLNIKDAQDGCKEDDKNIKFLIRDNSNITGTSIVILKQGESRKFGDMTKDSEIVTVATKNLVITANIIGGNKLCLTMPTSNGVLPLICKNISTSSIIQIPENKECKNIGTTCYSGASKSQSIFNFSGLAIDCLKETLDMKFYGYKQCNVTSNLSTNSLNPFSSFQKYLRNAVLAGLTLYVIIFGLNILLNPQQYAKQDKIFYAIIKILFVMYFAIGIGGRWENGREINNNGVTEYVVPFLTSAAPYFAEIVFNASASKGLCEFDSSKYKRGYGFYSIWDAVDCRIAYYLGMGLIYNAETILNSLTHTTNNNGSAINIKNIKNNNAPADLTKVGAFRFFIVMFGFLMSGNIIIVASGIAFSLIFMSIMLYFISHYIVCFITIYVMAYISPIFIPMILFERTKSYFDSWVKICISCALQPAVVAGFIALLLTMYDGAIYKNCQFSRHEYKTSNDTTFNTFELRLPDSESELCKNSLGYKLLNYYSGNGWSEKSLMFISVKTIATDSFNISVELLYVLVFSIIFYHAANSIGAMASSLTSGPLTSAVTASPQAIVKAAASAAEFIKNIKPPQKMAEDKAKEVASGDAGNDGLGGDKANTGGGESSGGESAVDKIGS
jgi:type IV secretion system protein VirB6